MFWSQHADRPSRPRSESGLHHPGYGLQGARHHEGHLRSCSYYLKAEKHPVLSVAMAGATLLVSGTAVQRIRRRP